MAKIDFTAVRSLVADLDVDGSLEGWQRLAQHLAEKYPPSDNAPTGKERQELLAGLAQTLNEFAVKAGLSTEFRLLFVVEAANLAASMRWMK